MPLLKATEIILEWGWLSCAPLPSWPLEAASAAARSDAEATGVSRISTRITLEVVFMNYEVQKIWGGNLYQEKSKIQEKKKENGQDQEKRQISRSLSTKKKVNIHVLW